MRSLILIGTLCVLALTTITTIVHGANPFACNDVCVSAQQYCTAACQKESLRPVCSQACQDGYQSCLTTCTIGDAAASNAEESVAVPMSVTPSSSIRHRIHSAKQHKKHNNNKHQRFAPSDSDPCHRGNPWFCAGCQSNGGECQFPNADCQICVFPSSSTGPAAAAAHVSPETLVKQDNDDQCIQACNTNGADCTARCQLSCSVFPGNECPCAYGPYTCADQQAQCIAACDE